MLARFGSATDSPFLRYPGKSEFHASASLTPELYRSLLDEKCLRIYFALERGEKKLSTAIMMNAAIYDAVKMVMDVKKALEKVLVARFLGRKKVSNETINKAPRWE